MYENDGFNFSKLYTPSLAPMSSGAHSAATRHIAPSKVNRFLQTKCGFMGFGGCWVYLLRLGSD